MSGHGGGHGKKRGKGNHHEEEEHENHERWLVSYADMITLLFVLFVVLYAISQVDQRKFAALKDGMAAGFGAPLSSFDGGQGPLNDKGTQSQPLDVFSSVTTPTQPSSVSQKALEAAEKARLAKVRAEASREVKRMEDVERKLKAELDKRGLLDDVRFRIDERGLVISIITDKVIFPADRAELTPVGASVLGAIAPAVREVPNDIIVEGHTNTVPVAPKYFPSEWELSSARASAVVRFLVDKHAFDAKKMQATGRADQHPLYPASDPQANRLNRRVEVILVSGLTAEQKAMLPEEAATSKAAKPEDKVVKPETAGKQVKAAAQPADTGKAGTAAEPAEAAEPVEAAH